MVDLDTRAGTGTTNNCCRCRDEAGFMMGPNQEGLLISVLENYSSKGITQADAKPGLRHRLLCDAKKLRAALRMAARNLKLALKLAATFQYGIFDRPQPPISAQIIRFDLSTLGRFQDWSDAAESLTSS